MRLRSIFYLLISLTFIIVGCETLRSSRPIKPIREYERMLVGRLDADYVGTEKCLSACHYHDKIRHDFDASTMGAQIIEKTGLPLVNCESCHGPGSLAIKGLTPEKVKEDAKRGIQTKCNYETLLDIKSLPAPAKSLICLKCHTANATFNLHNWNAGEHAINDVTCTDCHDVHKGPDLIVRKYDMANMCERCHQEIKSEFSLISHHPIPERKIFCTDCHNPHGSGNERMLREPTVKKTCTRCHAEKEGPFIYEHAENTEDCLTCHTPHGSVNNNLLTVRLPFLCLQCHSVHRISSTSSIEGRATFNTRCTDCHSQIHGTDLPSTSGKGRFIQ